MKKQIKIINCSSPESWYKNRIGEILIVDKVMGNFGTYVYEYHDGDINGIIRNTDIIEVNQCQE